MDPARKQIHKPVIAVLEPIVWGNKEDVASVLFLNSRGIVYKTLCCSGCEAPAALQILLQDPMDEVSFFNVPGHFKMILTIVV